MDPNTNEDEWSDEQLGAALKRLDEMHRQVSAVESSTDDDPKNDQALDGPTRFSSLVGRKANESEREAEELFRDFARAAETAVGEVKAFRRFRNDEKSRQALERAVASSKESREGITPWKATEHPNAFDPPEDEISDVVKDSEGAAINIQKGP